MGSPLQRYDRLVRDRELTLDPAQREALATLDELGTRLRAAFSRRPAWRSPINRLLRRRPAGTPEQGIWLWGGVGRGKTLLMDLFHQSLPAEGKLRMHFHRFMNRVHAELRELSHTADPLETVADRLALQTRVLCFDEFFVTDITDAMILGTLMDGLFRREVTLVATSNVPPRQLYRDGLQRARFVPAIERIEASTRVINLDSGVDYRLRLLERANVFRVPPDEDAQRHLSRWFSDIAGAGEASQQPLEVLGRSIPVRRAAEGVAWFDFDALCDGPRSQDDYIELARCHHTVLVSGVPQFDAALEDQARRFIAMIDEFYDRRVKLIMSLAAPVPELYRGNRLVFEFRRTQSRLQEMQTHDYLAAEHLP